jgi:NMD protein affecting ribosome stability and mRNA decay
LQEFHLFELGEDADEEYGEVEMSERKPIELHQHVAKRVHLVQQRSGIPYEVERQVCAECARVLDEKPLKRAAA